MKNVGFANMAKVKVKVKAPMPSAAGWALPGGRVHGRPYGEHAAGPCQGNTRLGAVGALLLAFALAIVLGLALPAGTALAVEDVVVSEGSSSASASASSSSSTAKGQVGAYVFDERGLFTSSEFNTLEASAAEFADKYAMGVYFLTTDYMDGLADPTSSQRTSYATTYYREHELGLNPTDRSYGDGIMFVIAADSRDYVTIAYGQGSHSFSDEGIEAMEEAVLDNIRDHRDDWYGAATTYYREIGSQLAYYDRHGDPQVPLDLFDWILRIFIIVGIPLIVAFFIVKHDVDAMKTAKERSEASNYLDPSSFVLTVKSDEFLHTTLTKTPRPKSNDSGGGGGGWGGGGGGGFSSSGGGKF